MRLPKKACSNNTGFFQQCRIFLKIHLFFFLSLYQVIFTSFFRVVLPLFRPVFTV